MKYKVGQKVRMKREEEIKSTSGCVRYRSDHKDFLERNNYIGTIGTIGEIEDSIFKFQGFDKQWNIRSIEGLYVEPIPVKSRFELLDIRKDN